MSPLRRTTLVTPAASIIPLLSRRARTSLSRDPHHWALKFIFMYLFSCIYLPTSAHITMGPLAARGVSERPKDAECISAAGIACGGSNPPAPSLRKEELARVSISLEILATSLGMRLTPDELEWLSMALKERAEQRRREVGSEPPVLAGYRDAWEPVRRGATKGKAERSLLEA